jgi:hypothetical protein
MVELRKHFGCSVRAHEDLTHSVELSIVIEPARSDRCAAIGFNEVNRPAAVALEIHQDAVHCRSVHGQDVDVLARTEVVLSGRRAPWILVVLPHGGWRTLFARTESGSVSHVGHWHDRSNNNGPPLSLMAREGFFR